MHEPSSRRTYRLIAIALAVLLVTAPVAPVLPGMIGTASAQSTTAEWSDPTTITTATATDPTGNIYVNLDGGDTVNDGILRKYSPTGAQQYETTIASAPFNTLAASNTTVAVAASQGGFDAEPGSTYLKALHPENGTVRWEQTGSDYGDVKIHDGAIVALNRTGQQVEAYDAQSGDRLWSYAYTGSANGGQDTLAVDDHADRVYLPAGGQIIALDAGDGTEARSYTPPANVARLTFDARDRRLLARYSNDGSTLGVVNVTDSGLTYETNITLQGGIKGWSYDSYSETFYHGNYNGGTPTVWAYNLSDLTNPNHYDSISTGDTPHALATHSTPGANTTLVAGTQQELQVYDSGQQAHALPDRSTAVVSGIVRTESGAPCMKCTVRAMAVNYSALDVRPEEYDQRAVELLDRAQNATPTNWQTNVTLTGTGGVYADASGEYVAVHTRGDWHPGTFYGTGVVDLREDPALDSPRTHVPAGEPVVLSVRDPTRSPFYQDDIDEDLRGVTTSGTIVIKQVGPGNSTLDTLTVDTKPAVRTLTGKDHHIARVALDRGFYRIHVEGSGVVVPLTVGDPEKIAMGYASDLRDRADRLSNHAQQIRDYEQTGRFKSRTTSTDAGGRFTFSFSDANLKRVGIVAYRVPDGLSVAPENATLRDVRAYYETTNTSESIYLPSSRTTTAVPAENVSVRVREHSTPPYLSPGRYSNLSALLADYLRNQSFADLRPALQQQLADASRADLEQVYRELDQLSRQNDELRDRYRDVLAEQGEMTVEVGVSNASNADLRQRVRALQQSITELQATLDTGNTGVTSANGSVSSQAMFNAPLDREHVSVVGHWSNGTSFVVPDEYLALDQHAVSRVGVRSTTVHVEDYPVTEQDPENLRFEYRIVTPDGVASTTTTAENPEHDGGIPEIAAVDLSTLQPGPNEQVTATVYPSEGSSFRRVADATVYGPSGALVDHVNVSGGDTIAFDTAGAGRYTLKLTLEATDGTTVVESVHLDAGTTSRDRAPSVRITSGPTGVYALTGESFTTGSADLGESGDQLEVQATLPEGADRPRMTHLHVASVQPGRSADLTLRVTRPNGTAVKQTIPVTVHGKRVKAGALVYRGDTNPIADSGTRYGVVERQANGTIVESYTNDEGVLRVRMVNAPSLWEQAVYEWRLRVSSISLVD